jgi:hypothetical protein
MPKIVQRSTTASLGHQEERNNKKCVQEKGSVGHSGCVCLLIPTILIQYGPVRSKQTV